MVDEDDLTLAQRMLLLAYDPARERVTGRSMLGLVLTAAALQQLLDDGYVTDQGGRVVATGARGSTPSGALEAAVYARIGASARHRTWRHWVKKSERQSFGVVRDELAGLRVLRVTRTRVLLVFPHQAVALRQPRLRTEAMRGVREALRPTLPPSRVPPASAAALVLAITGGMSSVMTWRERRAARPRAGELAEALGPVPAALRKAVRDKQAADSGHGG